MEHLTFTFCRFEIYDIGRVSFTITIHMDWMKVAITATQLVLSNTFVVWFTFCHLRIVYRLLVVKDTNIFMFSQRLLLSIQEVGGL